MNRAGISRARWVGLLSCALGAAACFDGKASSRGLPCTSDAACDRDTCSYGVCGGPARCATGASVGEYCFAVIPEKISVGDDPAALTVGDVNHDLLRDIVSIDRGSRSLSIRLGHADGTFEAVGFDRIDLDFVPTSVGIGAVDGDGWADLVVTANDGAVHVILLDQSGALSIESVAEPVGGARAPAISDFVDDDRGLADIAVLGDSGIRVARRTEGAGFEPTWIETHISDPTDILTVRDATGVPTTAYVALASNDEVTTFGRDADGKFSASAGIAVGPAPQKFVLVDINNDAYLDVVSATAQGEIWRTLGKTTGAGASQDRWSHPEKVYDLGWVPDTLVADNLDDDDDAELVIAGGPPDGHRDVYLFDNDGDGNLIYGGSLGLQGAAGTVLSDVDRDSVPEILIATSDGDAVRLARRTVAPPPPDGGTTSNGESGKPATSGGSVGEDDVGEDDGSAGATTVPVDTGWDTGPQCGYQINLGAYYYADCDYFPGEEISRIAFSDQSGDGLEDLVALSEDGSLKVFIAEPNLDTGGNNYNETAPVQVSATGIWTSLYPTWWQNALVYASGGELNGIANWGFKDGASSNFTIAGAAGPLPEVRAIAESLDTGILVLLTVEGLFTPTAVDVNNTRAEATALQWSPSFIPGGLAVPRELGEYAQSGDLFISNPDSGELYRLYREDDAGSWVATVMNQGLERPEAVFADAIFLDDGTKVALLTVAVTGGMKILAPGEEPRATFDGVVPAATVAGEFDGEDGVDLLVLDSATGQVGIISNVWDNDMPALSYIYEFQDVRDLRAKSDGGSFAEIWLALPNRVARLRTW